MHLLIFFIDLSYYTEISWVMQAFDATEKTFPAKRRECE